MPPLWFLDETCNVLRLKMTQTDLALDIIRKKVFFHNSVDVWISACEEKNTNPNAATYTIRLNDKSIDLIRKFSIIE